MNNFKLEEELARTQKLVRLCQDKACKELTEGYREAAEVLHTALVSSTSFDLLNPEELEEARDNVERAIAFCRGRVLQADELMAQDYGFFKKMKWKFRKKIGVVA